MTDHYHAIVWIDHHEARVFHFNTDASNEVVVHPKNPVRHIHHKANEIGSGHAPEDQKFFHDVVTALGDAGGHSFNGTCECQARAAEAHREA